MASCEKTFLVKNQFSNCEESPIESRQAFSKSHTLAVKSCEIPRRKRSAREEDGKCDNVVIQWKIQHLPNQSYNFLFRGTFQVMDKC